MSITTLTLALSVFTDLEIRAVNVGKFNPEYYQVYYKRDGVNRIMLVPRSCDNFEKLQKEVAVLLKRNIDEQNKIGHLDGKAKG